MESTQTDRDTNTHTHTIHTRVPVLESACVLRGPFPMPLDRSHFLDGVLIGWCPAVGNDPRSTPSGTVPQF